MVRFTSRLASGPSPSSHVHIAFPRHLRAVSDAGQHIGLFKLPGVIAFRESSSSQFMTYILNVREQTRSRRHRRLCPMLARGSPSLWVYSAISGGDFQWRHLRNRDRLILFAASARQEPRRPTRVGEPGIQGRHRHANPWFHPNSIGRGASVLARRGARFYRRQKAGRNSTRILNSSRRPRTMHRDRNALPTAGMWA